MLELRELHHHNIITCTMSGDQRYDSRTFQQYPPVSTNNASSQPNSFISSTSPQIPMPRPLSAIFCFQPFRPCLRFYALLVLQNPPPFTSFEEPDCVTRDVISSPQLPQPNSSQRHSHTSQPIPPHGYCCFGYHMHISLPFPAA